MKHYGRARNRKYPGTCLDHLQRDTAHHGSTYFLGQYPCHGDLGDSQYFSISANNEMRNEYMCGEARKDGDVDKMAMYTCHGAKGNQLWSYDKAGGMVRHESTGLCMSVAGEKAGDDVILVKCDSSDLGQQWDWDYDQPRQPPEP